MLKRLMMVLLAISLVALFLPAAAGAGCQTVTPWGQPLPDGWCYTKLSGYNCIYCQGTGYSVSGEPTSTSQCLYWWPGSGINGLQYKFLPTDTNQCEGENCPTCLSVVFGAYDENDKYVELDVDAYSKWWAFCCPPGHVDKKTGLCDDPVYSSGNPGYHIGVVSNAGTFTELGKRVSKLNVEVDLQFCPNPAWYEESFPTDFNGVTCCCPRGFDKVGNEYKCCYERNEEGECKYANGEDAHDPVEGVTSIDDAAPILHCVIEGELPTYVPDEYDKCDGIGFVGDFVEEGEFCNWLYTEFMTSKK